MPPPSPSQPNRIERRLKLRDLDILSKVVQWGSMAKAAGPLGMTQPAVSEAIAGLEGTLGVRLLDRSPQGVTPTIYGRTLLRRTDVVFDELQQGLRDIEFLATPGVGTVRIGCPESLSAGLVPAIVERLTRRHPKVSVHVIAAQPGEQEFRELRERTVDLLIGRVFKPLSMDDVMTEILCDDAFFVVAGAANPWVCRRKVKLADLVNEAWLFFPEDSLSNAYIREGFRANRVDMPAGIVSSFSMQLRFHLLANANFLTVLHGSVLAFNAKPWSLRALPIDLRIPPMPLAIFTLKNRTLSPVVQLFVEHARGVVKRTANTFIQRE
jgi:DNA-binding transcriptional LysR family regulator